ncbi:MAG: hypothetical protein GEU87_12750 [Alphaproteobacteria bacterium]|nr:hypothetical protein [Alphaproteobacteria bacterium]
MSRKTDILPDAVLQQAVAWLHRVQAAPNDEALLRAVDDWIAEDEAHGRAWALTRKAWTLAGDIRPVFAETWEDRPASTGRKRLAAHGMGRQRFALAMTAALAACLVLFVAAPELTTWLRASYTTAAAEAREILLEDGSSVHLSADTAISTHFAADGRTVTLLQGEAFFQVSQDSARPFSVKAGALTVTVTGTAFDVALTEATLSVAVASGSVRVAYAGTPGAQEFALSPGQRLAVDRETGVPAKATVVAEDIAAWRGGRLVVEDAAVPDVLDAIARYHRGAVLVVSPSLKQRRVTGVFDLRDPARALKVLANPFGGVVREVTPYLLTVSDF